MKKAVLISIQPKWCELIANGKKTVEARKTRPKIDVPFKCYIYETRGESDRPILLDGGALDFHGRGQVIGEFVCDRIRCEHEVADGLVDVVLRETSCVSYKELIRYANGKVLYSWHISDLVIYDKPKELSEFYSYNCGVKVENGYPIPTHEIKRPPQSWCYVEERSVNDER